VAPKPRHKKEESSLRVARIGAVATVLAALIGAVAVVLVALIGAGATLRGPHTGTGSSTNAPGATSSSQPSANVTSPGSTFGTGLPPAPTDSPSLLPAPSPTATPTASSSATLEPTGPVPTPTVQPSVPTDNPQLNLSINVSTTPVFPGTYLTSMNLIWTPTVTLGNQIVVQNCQIAWYLFDGGTLIYNATSSCSGTFKLPMPLPIGHYLLVGRVNLTSGQQAQSWVDIPAGCDTTGTARRHSPVDGDLQRDLFYWSSASPGDLRLCPRVCSDDPLPPRLTDSHLLKTSYVKGDCQTLIPFLGHGEHVIPA
jgi:hypothetical protein